MDSHSFPSPQITSTERVQPAIPTTKPTTTYLSIVDCTTATFGTSSALWVFKHFTEGDHAPWSFGNLISALKLTLSIYPHFAGRLGLTPWPKGDYDTTPHSERFRRSVVTHGFAGDPGVEVQTASLDMNIDDIFPDAQTRATTDWCCDFSEVPIAEIFSPNGDTAGNVREVPEDTPSVRVRITGFSCQSVAIAIKISHPLADAEAMLAFMKIWGLQHTKLLGKDIPTIVEPIFDPTLLDSQADGNVDGPSPDPALIQRATDLPLPWYDWWEHRTGKPEFMDENPQVVIPPQVPEKLAQSRHRGRRIPWEEWDLKAPVKHFVIRISSKEIDDLYTAVQSPEKQGDQQISRHDVVLALIWQLIAKSKPPWTWAKIDGLVEPECIYLDTTLGLRPRLNLPRAFLGSPILLAGMKKPYWEVTGEPFLIIDGDKSSSSPRDNELNYSTLLDTARSIRQHLNTFDRTAVGAYLHTMAFELAPQRWWNGFLGNRHTMATSWVRAGVWDVDFGFATVRPRENSSPVRGPHWAGVIGPTLDGLVTITEAEGGLAREWWKRGVDIDVKLEAGAMQRFLNSLQGWRSQYRGSSSG